MVQLIIVPVGVPKQCIDHRFRYSNQELCTATQKLSTPYSVCGGKVHLGFAVCWRVDLDCWSALPELLPDNVGLVFASLGLHDALRSASWYSRDSIAGLLKDSIAGFMGSMARRNALARNATREGQVPKLSRVVFMDAQPLCAHTAHLWTQEEHQNVRQVFAEFNPWLQAASQSTCEQFGVVGAHRLLEGQCGWSPDGVHFYKQAGPAIVTALLDGLDPQSSCGRATRANDALPWVGGAHCTLEEANRLPVTMLDWCHDSG